MIFKPVFTCFVSLLCLSVVIMAEQKSLKTLKNVIKGHKAYIARFTKQIAEIQEQPLDLNSGSKLKGVIRYLETRLDNLDGVISELIVHPDITDPLIDQSADYMAQQRVVIELAEADLKRYEIANLEADAGSRRFDSTPASPGFMDRSTGGRSDPPRAKLPKAPFPTFSGGPTGSRDLRIFLRMFEDLVGPNCSESERVTYLRLGIKGEAEVLIRHIDPIPENYELMLDTLRLQYKPKEGECRELWGKLMSIQSWRKCNTSQDILNLIHHVRQNIYLIREEDPDANTEHETLVDAIMVLLPERLMYDITRDIPKPNRTVERLLSECERFIVAREEVASYYQGVPKGSNSGSSVGYASGSGSAGRGGSGPSRGHSTSYSSGPNRSYSSPGSGHSRGGFHGRRGTHSAQVSRGHGRGSGGKGGWSAPQAPSVVQAPSLEPCLFCKKSDPPHKAHTCRERPNVSGCREILKAERCCFNCLDHGHMLRECTRESMCNCGKGKHSPCICFASERAGQQSSFRPRCNTMALPKGSGPTFMETAWVIVENPDTGAWCKARIFIDRGSSDSYCTMQLVQQLGCKPLDEQKINIGTFASEQTMSIKSQLVSLNIVSNFAPHQSIPVQLLTMQNLCGDLPSYPLAEQELRQLSSYSLADPKATQCEALSVDILIGMDYLWSIMKDRVECTGFGPRLLETELGWVLSGPLSGTRARGKISAYLIRTYFVKHGPELDSDEEFYRIIHQLWDLDVLGVKESEVSPVMSHFNETVEYTNEGRVMVRIPWKEEIKAYLPTNYCQALIRFNVTKQKLNRPGNEALKAKYHSTIADYLEKGIIERVPVQPESVFVNPQPEPQALDPNTALIGTNDPLHQIRFYMPHHHVTKHGSDKVRVVFDASCTAHSGALSLNEVIHGGPSLLTDLSESLMRFRLNNVALVGDIEKAYLGVALHPADRDGFRFLWSVDDELVEYRFARVPFGVIVSSFLLNAVLRFHFGKEFESNPELLELITSSIYVDDLLSGARDVESAKELKQTVELSLKKIGMKLHGWSSNSKELRLLWESAVDKVVSVLGLLWDPVEDSLSVNIPRVLEAASCEPTKKNLLSLTASVWDPLGLVQPFLVLPKLLFQQVCKSKLGWRGKLPEEMAVKWESWKSQLPDLAQISLPRQITLPEFDSVELHCFSDASESAYAACFYVKCVYGLESRVNLVFAKNRIAPLAAHTLPRLELLGACLLSRLVDKVVSTHKPLRFDKVVYYSDSKNVLHWINSDNRQWSIFVQNRVVEIHRLTKAADWRYVRSERNPADVATRPISGPDLVSSEMWWHGPSFLVDETIACGDKVNVAQPTPECLAERKKSAKVVVREDPETILDLKRYSSFAKVMRVTSLVLKFIARSRGKVFGVEDPSFMQLHNLSVHYWVRKEQLASYPTEVKKCPEGRYLGQAVATVSGLARNLRLFKDSDGLLRYSSRVQDKFAPYNTSNPILLTKNSRFTWLYIAYMHRLLSHAGVAELLVHVRKTFWIPQGRSKVRSVVHQCVPCRRIAAKPYPILASPPLPDFRVTPSHPFEHTGIDTAGPVYYKVGRVRKKGHILLLTCAVIRAVELEFITGLSVEQVMLGLRRFFARCGLPREIRSDNAKSFKRCQKELIVVSKSPKMKRYLDDHRITWIRYLERSPWWGGFIERCVQTIKRVLHRVLGSAVLTFEEYTTVLYEISALVNSRPITSVLDSSGEAEPLSPAMLMHGRSLVQVPPIYELKVDGKEPQLCTGRLRYLEKLKTYWWNRWRKEYLSDVREVQSRRKVGNRTREPVVGEMVFVQNEKLARGTWKMGLVVGTKPGRDGCVRSVRVKVCRGKFKKKGRGRVNKLKLYKTTELNRSPRHLVPLEGITEE